ncbi:inhibitor of cysteine peptidase [Angomonas deanei]|uniref:Chagasin family peptidase inhibitor I42, putative n=1 Tax=Angomonas deanei TaxID=59799 RepID=A0A7G2CIU5_9TRYP|nr:inhibitor of cysteine peptidase [Angomonas deanei]CAD2219770.1 Chagasin family peptidase inhibitor I42, putative [Angomonas deanei]|eukprot:EPY40620.1 inhibitor of cysteine peptidase [Angomonas deanei]
MTVITVADQGKTVSVQSGGSVTIKLPGNPTTGYTWAVQSPNEELYATTKSYDSTAPPGMVGGGGEFTFTVTPKKSGTIPLVFLYLREFEGPKDTDKKFDVTLKVE